MIQNSIFTVSSATTITITDCPCTVSAKVPAASTAGVNAGGNGGMGGAASSAGGNGGMGGAASTAGANGGSGSGMATGAHNNGTASTTKPAVYTGAAAAQYGAGMGFLGVAAGAVMLL
jgi:hypothetical protein